MPESNTARVPTVGDSVLYWVPKREGQPFIPRSRLARVAGVSDEEVMLSVDNNKGGRFRVGVPREPRTAHPEGGWSWPVTETNTSENDQADD